ncbi:hypothetical protein GCM10007981_07620 [Thermocladium modestius]|uniref:Uncharacterized protein n=1 Tax=Thermocladium modestius TaxID=62609 RepID=A0A830GSM2_9CREN|nr:helix-turn-helix domain-containing protein [Thermocladium modestius]GGP20261.1 hypothetical protein GCM10007981_07620 [Thermocladium modestius]
MSYKLSKTELTVGDMYFKQGMKPREIAERLGISVNTVYKAISKYKAVHGEQQAEPETQVEQRVPSVNADDVKPAHYTITFTISTQYQPQLHMIQEKCDDQLQVELLLKLASSLDALSSKVSELERKIMDVISQRGTGDGVSQAVGIDSTSAPDFVRDNVWVDVIRSKHFK